MLEFLSNYSGALTGVAALIGACVAIYGISEWKRQFKWRIEYETARRYIRALYDVREAINRDVRNPTISHAEMKAAEEAAQFKGLDVTRADTQWIIYNRRWEKVSVARTNLREALLETEVLWGNEIKNAQSALDALIGILYGKIWAIFHNVPTPDADIYLYHTDGKDSFTAEIDNVIEGVAKPLRSHLR
ncbi:MAG: hypothetical protein G01um10148_1038 [Parcubacteria group bacterium Gr01-1014_8]|nr:MAG: hypothetical protein G01um10148_1038 [Parcubacteria group bacterium Gr01-1014_8]